MNIRITAQPVSTLRINVKPRITREKEAVISCPYIGHNGQCKLLSLCKPHTGRDSRYFGNKQNPEYNVTGKGSGSLRLQGVTNGRHKKKNRFPPDSIVFRGLVVKGKN